MSPSLFLVRTILTLEKRAIYSSNLSFKCSRDETENVEKDHRTLIAAELSVGAYALSVRE